MDTYASVADVTKRWARTPTDAEATLIETRLEDAERKIRRRIKDLDEKVTDETILTKDVIQVEADAVLRLVRNPDGYLSESDGSYSYTVARDLAAGRLEIFPDEWETLGVSNGLVTIRPRFNIPHYWHQLAAEMEAEYNGTGYEGLGGLGDYYFDQDRMFW